MLEVFVGLRLRLSQLIGRPGGRLLRAGLVRTGGGGPLRALRLRELREPTLVGDLDHRGFVSIAVIRHDEPPSSTISPSTTSSSPDDAGPSAPASPPPAAAAVGSAAACWYMD